MSASNAEGLRSNGYTPTQRKMLAVLSDGLPHSKAELHSCLHDDLGAVENIQIHLTNIRKRIRPKGEDILTQFIDRRLHYRLVRLIAGGSPAE